MMFYTVGSVSRTLLGSCFQAFDATGSKSSPFHYEKPDLLCQWETIRRVVSDPANNPLSVCFAVRGRTHARTHRLLCHAEDSLALGNAYFWKTMTGKQRDLYCGEARDASLLVFPAYFRLTDSASGLLKQCFAC